MSDNDHDDRILVPYLNAKYVIVYHIVDQSVPVVQNIVLGPIQPALCKETCIMNGMTGKQLAAANFRTKYKEKICGNCDRIHKSRQNKDL